MKARRVRFVEQAEIIGPEPLTPSKNDAPKIERPVPPAGALVHPLLAAPITPCWDLRIPIKAYVTQWTHTSRNQLADNATHPPTTRLELLSPHLPWRIEVRPRTPNIIVTVYDVLATVQAALRLEITPEEWAQFELTGKRLIVAARNSRIQEYDPGRQADEAFDRPRRIDSLGEFTRLVGLVPVPQRGPGSFDIQFERRR